MMNNCNNFIKRVIGVTRTFKWTITTNGAAVPLVAEDLTLQLVPPRGEAVSLPFDVDDNVVSFTWQGDDQHIIGCYSLILWANFGEDNQRRVDIHNFVELIPWSDRQSGEYSDLIEETIELETADFGENIMVVDNLNSTSATDALSANMGRQLNVTKQDVIQDLAAIRSGAAAGAAVKEWAKNDPLITDDATQVSASKLAFNGNIFEQWVPGIASSIGLKGIAGFLKLADISQWDSAYNDRMLPTVAAVKAKLQAVLTALATIEAVIPSQASSTNKLTDKDYVDGAIATNTANFVGTFDTLAELQAVQNPTKNDYGFVIEQDAQGNEYYDRYKYTGTQWLYEYKVESTPFTTEQWAAIQSGITAALVTKLSALPTNAELNTALAAKQPVINDLTTIRSGAAAGATAYQKPSGGIPASDTASAVQTTLIEAKTDHLIVGDKQYNSSTFSGIGRINLEKNIVSVGGTNKNVLTQAMMNTTNTIYKIQYDYDLNEQTITVPTGCVLEFDGGSLSNGTIVGQATKILSSTRYIFRDVSISGVANEIYYSDWFVRDNTGATDCSSDMNYLFSSGDGHTIIINEGKYKVNANYILAKGTKIKGYSIGTGGASSRKSHFYLHDCTGVLFDCSAGYIQIEGLTLDGTNNILDNSSNTLQGFVVVNGLSGFVNIRDCEMLGTQYLGACALNLGQSMWSEIRNLNIHSISNGYAAILNGANTTVNFYKIYFHYCRQILDVASSSGYTKFSNCVFESSYTIGRLQGHNIFDTCHFENIGYDLSQTYKGLTTIYDDANTYLDSFIEIIRGAAIFSNSIFYHALNGNRHTYGFRLYPNDAQSSGRYNGYLLLDNCKLNEIGNSFDLRNTFYVKYNNEDVTVYFKIEMNCDYVGVGNSLYPYVKKLKGYGHGRLSLSGNRGIEMDLEYGVAHYKFAKNSTVFLVPANMPVAKLDDEYIATGFFTYPTGSYEHRREYISFAATFELSNVNVTAGTPFTLPTDSSQYPAYYIKVGDKFTIYTNATTAVTGTITARTDTTVTFDKDFSIGSAAKTLNIYATRPANDSYGICSRLPSNLTSRQVGCIAIVGTSTYRWNGSSWMNVTGEVVS